MNTIYIYIYIYICIYIYVLTYRYGIGFDARSYLSLSSCSGLDKNIIIFVFDNSYSVHADYRKKDILILGKEPTDILNDTTITAEAEYFINFSEQQNNFA